MQTVYDWVTMAMFCGLVTLFLQRSMGPEVPGDHMLRYLPPALSCAVANFLGTKGYDAGAIALMVATLLYVLYVLKPGRGWI
jgi:hypothetical protein